MKICNTMDVLNEYRNNKNYESLIIICTRGNFMYQSKSNDGTIFLIKKEFRYYSSDATYMGNVYTLFP